MTLSHIVQRDPPHLQHERNSHPAALRNVTMQGARAAHLVGAGTARGTLSGREHWVPAGPAVRCLHPAPGASVLSVRAGGMLRPHLGEAVLLAARSGPPYKAHEDQSRQRPSRERPAFSEGKAPGSRFPGFPRPDAASPRATAALRKRTPGRALRAGADRGGRQLPLAPGVPRASRGGACVMAS